MLVVHRDSSRPDSQGQFWVELVEDVGGHHKRNPSRVGYWCDQAHLRHMVFGLLEQFRYELFSALLDGSRAPGPPDRAEPLSGAGLSVEGCWRQALREAPDNPGREFLAYRLLALLEENGHCPLPAEEAPF